MTINIPNLNVDDAQAISVINAAIAGQWTAAQNIAKVMGMLNVTSGLRHEDFLRFKQTIIDVRRETLVSVVDLLSRGLVTSEEFTTTLIGYERMNEFRDAIQTMGEVTDDNNDTDFDEILTPMPITHSGWSIQPRQNKSYKRQKGLQESVRTVTKKLDVMVVNGSPGIVVGGQTIFGYLTHPNRLTDTISDWSDFTTNGDKIVPEATDLINRLQVETFAEGPIMMYIAPNLNGNFSLDYKAEANKTIRNRLLDGNPQLADIKVNFRLPDNTVVLVEMTSRTIEISRASDVVTVPHINTKGPMLSTQKFTTFAVMVPIFHVDRNDILSVLSAAP